MRTHSLLGVCATAFIATLAIGTRPPALSAATPNGHADEGLEQLVAACGGEPCDAVNRGFRAFFDRRLVGLDANGRACADCHMATDDFQLSPANVEARYQLLQLVRRWYPSADDPLFRPIDADDFRLNGENASDFSNLRQNGLIRIEFPLPSNMRVIDPETNQPSSDTFVDVWRSVPSVHNVAFTGPGTSNPWFRGPHPFGGYQLDGRFGTLQEQALGALTAHAEMKNEPPPQLLDDLSSFQRVLFTNHRVRALSDAIREGSTTLPDPDAPLSELEERGKAVFQRACTQCHGGPDQTTAQPPVPHFQDILTQCPRPVDTAMPPRFVFATCEPRLARNVRTYAITVGNSVVRRTSSDPGRALLTGFVGGPPPADDWNKMDVRGLRGISKTAPYFHNNSAATLEDVVDHYIAFFKRFEAIALPGAAPPASATTDGVHFDRKPLPEEREALLAYLRKL